MQPGAGGPASTTLHARKPLAGGAFVRGGGGDSRPRNEAGPCRTALEPSAIPRRIRQSAALRSGAAHVAVRAFAVAPTAASRPRTASNARMSRTGSPFVRTSARLLGAAMSCMDYGKFVPRFKAGITLEPPRRKFASMGDSDRGGQPAPAAQARRRARNLALVAPDRIASGYPLTYLLSYAVQWSHSRSASSSSQVVSQRTEPGGPHSKGVRAAGPGGHHEQSR